MERVVKMYSKWQIDWAKVIWLGSIFGWIQKISQILNGKTIGSNMIGNRGENCIISANFVFASKSYMDLGIT